MYDGSRGSEIRTQFWPTNRTAKSASQIYLENTNELIRSCVHSGVARGIRSKQVLACAVIFRIFFGLSLRLPESVLAKPLGGSFVMYSFLCK